MGRWGDGVYQSDAALDFFAREVADQIQREMAYRLSFYNIQHPMKWLGHALNIIEMIILFDRHKIGGAMFGTDGEAIVAHWKSIIFTVWDDTWDIPETDPPFCKYDYRVQNRSILALQFEQLDELSGGFRDNTNYLDELPNEHQPPYFSIYQETLHNGTTRQQLSGAIVGILNWDLIKYIIATLAVENTENAVDLFEIEEVWVCADIIGFLCDIYELSPGMTVRTIDRWEKRMYDIWMLRNNLDPSEAIPTAEYEDLIDRILHRLRQLAKQYPSSYGLD